MTHSESGVGGNGGDGGERSISVTVDVVENTGSDNYIYLDVAGQECRVRVPSGVKPSVDEQVELDFQAAHIHVFDRSTGENLLVDWSEPTVMSDEQTV